MVRPYKTERGDLVTRICVFCGRPVMLYDEWGVEVGSVDPESGCGQPTFFIRCPEHPEVVHVYTDGCNTAECPVC